MIEQLRNGAKLAVEKTKIDAIVRKAKFDALLKEGFSESQALEIVAKAPVFE